MRDAGLSPVGRQAAGQPARGAGRDERRTGGAASVEPAPYTYDPQGRRDPFVSLLARGSDPRGASTRAAGLPGVLIAEASVKGIVRDRSGFIAMVQGTGTKTFIVRAGEKLMDGTVKAITADSVVFSAGRERSAVDGEAEGSAEDGSIRRRRTGVRTAFVGGMIPGERAQPMMAQEGSAQMRGAWSRRGAAIAGLAALLATLAGSTPAAQAAPPQPPAAPPAAPPLRQRRRFSRDRRASRSPAARRRNTSAIRSAWTSRASISRSVLRTFAEISGLNMVIDPDVQGTVDIVLTDVPWDQALEVILRGNRSITPSTARSSASPGSRRCAASRTRAPQLAQSAANAGALAVRTYTLSYAKADQAAPLVKSSVLSPRGNVQIDARTNTLIITDLPARLDTVQQLLGDASIAPSRRSKIEARIITTTRDYARALGVQWGFNGRANSTIGNTTGLTFPNNGSLGGRVGAQGPVGTDPRASRWTAPAPPSICRWRPTARRPARSAWRSDRSTARSTSTSRCRRSSAPARDGSCRRRGSRRRTTSTPRSRRACRFRCRPRPTTPSRSTYKDAALTLKVTPQITAANTVIMQITLENASPGHQPRSAAPAIDTQRAITRVQVNDGMTTVIGGIFVSREQTTNVADPVLTAFRSWAGCSSATPRPTPAASCSSSSRRAFRRVERHEGVQSFVSLSGARLASRSCGSVVREGTGTSFLIVDSLEFAIRREPDDVRRQRCSRTS